LAGDLKVLLFINGPGEFRNGIDYIPIQPGAQLAMSANNSA